MEPGAGTGLWPCFFSPCHYVDHMGKGHRDNHQARKKIGDVAFKKKADRRAPQMKCSICGTPIRFSNEYGQCKACEARLSPS